jgi:hypothetical protein
MKRLFKNRPLLENMRSIAAYITKGGNETLRYNGGFGRDLDDDLDGKILRAGESNGEKSFDERGLAIGEVKLLDQAWLALMQRTEDQRGYILRAN